MAGVISARTKWATALVTLVAGLGLLAETPRYTAFPTTPADQDRAAAYVQQNMPPFPDWTWGDHDFGQGTVRYGVTGNTDAATTLIFLPGYSTSLEFYGDLVRPWYEQGYRVVGMDLPGQGGSSRRADNPEKAWSGNIKEYADITASFIDFISRELDTDVILVGDSFGGHVALRTAQEHPELPLRGLLTNVPALHLHTPGFPPALAKGMTKSATALGLGHLYVPGQGNWSLSWDVDPETFHCGLREDRVFMNESLYTLHPEFRVGGPTHEWFAGVERSGRLLAQNADIALPITVVVADRDMVVKNDRAIQMCTDTLENCQLHHLDAEHCLNLESQDTIDQFNDIVDAFILSLKD